MLRDVRLALRRLRLAPGFTIFAVASLALGIGVSTAIYSAFRTLLWMPLGVPDEPALVSVTSHHVVRDRTMSWLDYQDFRAQPTSAASIAAATSIRTAFHDGPVARALFGEAISGSYFATIGLTPRLGRLVDEHDETAAARVVVVSDAFWRDALQRDPAVVGRTVRLGGLAFDVIGVVAGRFHGLDPLVPAAFWVPATAIRATPQTFELSADGFERRGYPAFGVWARLRPGRTAAAFAAEAAVIGQRFDAAYPSPRVNATRDWSAAAGTRDQLGSDAGQTIVFMVMTALAVVLLIACTNLANLALARGTARAQETAVRAALGASRWRLVREQVVESLIVVGCGGAGAVLVLFRLVDYFTADLPFVRGGTALAFKPEVDVNVLVAALAATLIAVLVFGVWPAFASTGSDVRLHLGAGVSATPPRWRFHRNLIAWQVCGSVALLLVAVMSARVLIGTGARQGSRYQDLAVAQIDFRLNGIGEGRARQLTDALLAATRRQRGIERVSASNGLPSAFFTTQARVGTPDDPSGARNRYTLTGMTPIAPDFLDTLGLGLVRGRTFTEHDDAGAPRVAIVSEQLARDLYLTTDVVGRELRLGSAADPRPVLEPVTIVGVARDITSLAALRPDRLVFVPLAQHYESGAPIVLLARSSNAAAAVTTLRAVVRQVEPSLAVTSAGTADIQLAGPLFLFRVLAVMSAALGGLALVLAMAGLFGVLSHVVERRRREIGIRLAIGAARGDVVWMVLRDGVRPVAKGLVLGLVIGLGVRIAMRGQVFTTIAAWDPVEFTLLPIVFLVAALIACWLPAARASRVDPNAALRDL